VIAAGLPRPSERAGSKAYRAPRNRAPTLADDLTAQRGLAQRAMISPARIPYRLRSTGATVPLSSSSTETSRFRSPIGCSRRFASLRPSIREPSVSFLHTLFTNNHRGFGWFPSENCNRRGRQKDRRLVIRN